MLSVSFGGEAVVHPCILLAVRLTKEPYDERVPLSTWTHIIAVSIHLDRVAISLEAVPEGEDPSVLLPQETLRWWRVAVRDSPDAGLTWYYGKMPITDSESVLIDTHLRQEVARLQVDLNAIDRALLLYGAKNFGEAWVEKLANAPASVDVEAMLSIDWPAFPDVLPSSRMVMDLETGEVTEAASSLDSEES